MVHLQDYARKVRLCFSGGKGETCFPYYRTISGKIFCDVEQQSRWTLESARMIGHASVARNSGKSCSWQFVGGFNKAQRMLDLFLWVIPLHMMILNVQVLERASTLARLQVYP